MSVTIFLNFAGQVRRRLAIDRCRRLHRRNNAILF
jgi:hypothetical protein